MPCIPARNVSRIAVVTRRGDMNKVLFTSALLMASLVSNSGIAQSWVYDQFANTGSYYNSNNHNVTQGAAGYGGTVPQPNSVPQTYYQPQRDPFQQRHTQQPQYVPPPPVRQTYQQPQYVPAPVYIPPQNNTFTYTPPPMVVRPPVYRR